jgi:hypothetical protein
LGEDLFECAHPELTAEGGVFLMFFQNLIFYLGFFFFFFDEFLLLFLLFYHSYPFRQYIRIFGVVTFLFFYFPVLAECADKDNNGGRMTGTDAIISIAFVLVGTLLLRSLEI